MDVIAYGPGGVDPGKPGSNVVERGTVVVPIEQVNEDTIREAAANALATNRAFLAIATPTNAQTLAQVKALTRQNQGVIRLLLGALDGTD